MEEETKKEEVKTPEKKKRNIILRIFDVIVWIVLFVSISTGVIDYFNVINNKYPQFCIKKETKEFEDGKEFYCKGILYETYIYERKSKTEYLFIPFWEKLKK